MNDCTILKFEISVEFSIGVGDLLGVLFIPSFRTISRSLSASSTWYDRKCEEDTYTSNSVLYN
jgi:hypothetical protein